MNGVSGGSVSGFGGWERVAEGYRGAVVIWIPGLVSC
jgi:hypothetical protein